MSIVDRYIYIYIVIYFCNISVSGYEGPWATVIMLTLPWHCTTGNVLYIVVCLLCFYAE